MQTRGGPAPDCLRAQAKAGLLVLEEAFRFFGHGEKERAFAAHQAHKAARHAGEKAKNELRGEWVGLSRAMGEAVDDAAKAVEETVRFEPRAAEEWHRMAGGLRNAWTDFCAALAVASAPERCEELLSSVKKRAGEVEHLYRGERRAALEEPNVVAGLKTEAVNERLSDAAEGLQRAADLLAERLASKP